MIYKSIFSSPLGFIEICSGDSDNITRVYFTSDPSKEYTENAVTTNAKKEFEEYFSGTRRIFEFPIKAEGTDFQKMVWKEVLENVPYGETRTYKEIACAVGDDKAARAVGNALNKNPVLIAVPCHRIIGKKNFLSGYATDSMIKESLISFEKKIAEISDKAAQ